jgi:hypothetical protein
MKVIARRGAVVVLALMASVGSMHASAWWDDDDWDDRWHGGPWYGGYPGYYGWGGYPGYHGWGGYPGYYGWGGHPGYGYPGSRAPSTIIVNPPRNDAPPEPEPQLPR